MMGTWFWFFIIVLQVACLGVGYRASKKHRSQRDYYLAGKQLTIFPLLMTFIATQVGGGLIMGSAEEAYRYGWKIIFYPLGAISGLFLLGISLGQRLSELNVSTVAEIFEVVYGSKVLRKIASGLSVLTLLMITAGQVLASQAFLTSFDLTHPLWFLLFWFIIFLYSMWGGMGGIVSIDIIQASFFIIALSLGACFLFFSSDPLIPLLQTSSIENTHLQPPWLGWFLMPCLFILIEQDMAQRCFSAKTSRTVKYAALGSGVIVFLVSLIPILFALVGKAKGIPVPVDCSVLLKVVQVSTPSWLAGGIACAIMMAIISTSVSLIHSIGSNIVQDFEIFNSSWTKKLSQKQCLIISKAITFGIGVLALCVSLFFGNIVDVLIQSYELSVVCLFIPVLMSLLGKHHNPLSAYLAIGFGGVSYLILQHNSELLPAGASREIIELLASFTGFGIGNRLKRFKFSPPLFDT